MFLCVPTPQDDDGSADLTYVRAAAQEISSCSSRARSSSTSRPSRSARSASSARRSAATTSPSCPTPSSCVRVRPCDDFLHPDRVVIGANDPAAARRVADALRSSRHRVRLHRPHLGGVDQVRRQRLPGDEDLVHQQRRRPLRTRRRRRRQRGVGNRLRPPDRQRVPTTRTGLGRQLLPQGLAGAGEHRRPVRLRLLA